MGLSLSPAPFAEERFSDSRLRASSNNDNNDDNDDDNDDNDNNDDNDDNNNNNDNNYNHSNDNDNNKNNDYDNNNDNKAQGEHESGLLDRSRGLCNQRQRWLPLKSLGNLGIRYAWS